MLLLKMFSSHNAGGLLLNNLDIVNTLESLQSFDMYPYLICENAVCFKMFVDILRLMITITTNTNHQIISEVRSGLKEVERSFLKTSFLDWRFYLITLHSLRPHSHCTDHKGE